MMENTDYSSNRTTNDDQQQQQQQQEARRNRRVDYRFLIPSRDAGGLKKFFLDISFLFFSFLKPLLAKVVKRFKNFV